MSRRQRQGNNYSVSLFPFLAVLICTMGMLIVMLVLAVKSSSVKADNAKRDQADQLARQRDELADKLDLAQFRVEKITAMRPKLQQRLEDEKLRRSHLDDEIRKLVQELGSVQVQLAKVAEDQDTASDYALDEAREIARLEQEISEREQGLESLKEEIQGRPLLYSIVPTRTTNGTVRRPIYVECIPDGIVLQPTGIKIKLGDFTQPILPGNPLDAALLAVREYWNKFDAGSSEGEPYPLIVVRPGGATAYAIARRAMTSWDDEFGYELVGDDKQLKWGETDPNLSRTLHETIEIAMVRQSRTVASGRARWLDGSTGARGSLLAGRYSPDGQNSGFETSNGGASSPNLDRSGAAATGKSLVANDDRQSVFDPSTTDSLSRFVTETRARQSGRPGSSPTTGSTQPTFNQNSLRPTPPPPGSRHRPDRSSQLAGVPSERAAGEKRDIVSENDQSGDQSLATQNRAAFVNENQAKHLAVKQSERATAASGAKPTDEQAPNAAPTSSGSSAGSSGGSPVQSLARQRGRGWALPTRTPGATPYRRPIRIDCEPDQYVVFSSDVDRRAMSVQIEDSIDVAIDELVNQVWKQIEDWGIAEAGGFWKPVLRLSTNSRGGARRADELAGKLKDSGLEIERVWR